MSVEHCFKSTYLLKMFLIQKRVKIHAELQGQNQKNPTTLTIL